MHRNLLFGCLRRIALLLSFFGTIPIHAAVIAEPERELVANGTMEADGGWDGYNIGSTTLPKLNEWTAADKYTGEHSRHIVIERTGSEYPGVKSPSFPTESGKCYEVRFWYKTVSGSFSVMMRNGASSEYIKFTPESFTPNYLILDAKRKELVWREFTGLYTEKDGGNGAYLCFGAGGPNVEFFIDDVSAVEVDRSIANVLRSWRKLFPKYPYVCWSKNPWDNLSRVSPPPAAVTECRNLALAMGENEYESASFVLTNLSDKTAEFVISVDGGGIPVTLQHAAWVTTRSGNEINEALPLLEGPLTIPSGESREVWLTLYSKGVKPGDYNSRITITSPGLPASSVNLKTEVYPVSLPEDKPIYTYYWDYLVPEWITPEIAQALVKDMKAHYVNVPMIHAWVGRLELDAAGNLKQDYTELDKLLGYYRQLNPKMVVFTWNPDAYLQKIGGFEMYSEGWKAIFKPYLTGLVSHLKEKGWGYDSFAIIPYDERIDKPFYDLAKLIKEIDPDILVCADHTGTKDQAKAIAPYVDIWMPFLHDYLNMGAYGPSSEKNLDPKILSKKPDFFWTYANPLSGMPQESSPYADYRLAVWRAWENGMSGFGYWIYSYKAHWNSYRHADGENWAVVYFVDAPDAPEGISKKELVVPGKRWEATREGIEDYVYLHMLKELAKKAEGKVSPELLNRAREVLSETPVAVLAEMENYRLADTAKETVLKNIAQLYEALNP